MAEQYIDFQRYRDEGALLWNYGVLEESGEVEPGFETMSDAVIAFFASVDETVTMQPGEGFPDGYSPLAKISDDLYRITRTI